ncbi:hypothetical protein ACWF82_31160 [Nocardia sp. NPDC055053]
MFGLKLLGKLAFGDLLMFVGVGFVLLVLASLAWDAVAAVVDRVRDRVGGTDRAEPVEPIRHSGNPDSRRSAASRDRHAARAAARRAAIHARRADDADVTG